MAATPIYAADYGLEGIGGKRFRRAYRVTIRNPYGGVPTVALDEELITEVEGRLTSTPTETLGIAVDLEASIDLFDPATGEPTGLKMTHGQVFTAFYSLYRQLAIARDEAAAQEG